ncbi:MULTISPECIES: SDR family NAD(P)-dependent oxidoreductase [unclassified Achromobacter]|uniref:SDR family NAD(P)-dependent oxidoreductase n=1 Tax=unclassified Achromobacter TaxID=2626865 RepID=UPI000B5170CE|nr:MULTISPECIES: glucose 1-dehydrogenase [unclassified Achromobacter]OWT76951.1 short-chain dehydrogenase [Achromobacter sp. HZ28]OWT77831.1 short-chain dehydrogenase [Achromobacter sp. HZ34]
MHEQKLRDKVAVVTGAASGIGAATALLFARQGARVALIDIDEPGLRQVAADIEAAGGLCRTGVCDVTQHAQVQRCADDIIGAWGGVDVIMPCSGVSVGGTVDTIDEALWDRVFDINVKGTYLWLHAVLPSMIARGGGSVILLGSQLVASSGGNNAAYIASKGALATLAKTMAVDHAHQGIRVNALMPGVTDTAMVRKSLQRYEDPEETGRRWMARHAMGRMGRPEEVARAALFLASDDSSFTTGSHLYVDGGWAAK